MTYVKICGIMELDHALCALEAGADMVGFVLASSRRQLASGVVAGVVSRCRELFPPEQRRWVAVGVFANQPLDFVERATAECALDMVQLSGQELPEYCRQLSRPLFRTVHVPELLRADVVPGPGSGCQSLRHEPHPPIGGAAGDKPLPYDGKAGVRRTLRAIQEGTGAVRLLLDSGGMGRWGGTGETFGWDQVGDAARDALVAGGLTPANVADAIATMHPWGVDVSSGVEIGGRKNPDLIRRFIEEVRRSDRHAAE